MPPRAAKVPFSSGGNRGFTIADAAWKAIETAYGRELSPAVREEMGSATAQYVDFATAEKAAPPSLPARRRIERLRKRAKQLLEELDERNSFAAPAPELYADELIYFHLYPRSNPKALLPGRRHLLLAPSSAEVERIVAGCDAALSEMGRTSAPGYWHEGSSWNSWVVQLTEIAASHGLPVGAAVTVKKAEPDQYSPFIRLVQALQRCLPSDLRRSMLSDDALTEAIKRARRAR